MDNEAQSMQQLYFDPNLYPEDTLKAFTEFVKKFQLRYDAKYPDPPKVSLDAAIARWKVEKTTEQNPNPTPNLQEYDAIRDVWRKKDRVAKFLGFHSSTRFYEDWLIACPNETTRSTRLWPDFVEEMKTFYRPTENMTLKNFHFRTLTQEETEAFPAFCNRVEKEAKHCNFKCTNAACTAEATATRDQIVIGTSNNKIREEALKESWDLSTLRREGMRIESAYKSGAEISGEAINRMGKYSKINSRKNSREKADFVAKKVLECFNCGTAVQGSIMKHKEKCPAKNIKCNKCTKMGHFAKVCKSSKAEKVDALKQDEQKNCENDEDDDEEDCYSINLFRLKASRKVKPSLSSNISRKMDFKTEVVINNCLDTVIADTGARISVCGTVQAKKWDLLGKMTRSRTRIKPYKSPPLEVHGEARCAVTFGNTSIPVIWHVISGSCEPVLSGTASLQLGIIKFADKPGIYEPVLMIDAKAKGKTQKQSILKRYPDNFRGIGKLQHHQVKLHVNHDVKPISEPPRTIPYHLKDRAQQAIDGMIRDGIIEEHPASEPAQWVSNIVLAPKSDGSIRVTMDARNVNKAILSCNYPIPRHEDIKAKFAGAQVFSKMDFTSAFWQIELEPSSRHLTVFHANDRLYRYKRLTMGLKPAQGELNSVLSPLFAHIPYTHVIHDDVVIAAPSDYEHDKCLEQVMETIHKSGTTLNAAKCTFGTSEISFWGMIYSKDGMQPDPNKVEALEYITAPSSKEEVLSFLCMMQSNAEFIPNFAKRSASLRSLTKHRTRFKWNMEHQQCFDELISAFKKDVLLRYFDMSKPTFVFTDAHITGLGAMLAQGEDIHTAKPVAFASRTTSPAESRYPQLDLEAMGLDFGLRRFRNYLVGSPGTIKVITDHKPLCPIFNDNRAGSIRTERIRMRHQDINYTVLYQKGKLNQSDYTSRRAKPFSKLSQDDQNESDEISNLLYMLHTTPVMDKIGIGNISLATKKDPTLQQILNLVKEGKRKIPNDSDESVKRFQKILSEISVTKNDILLKADRIILPSSLHATAIELAHRGSHPGQSGMVKRLRYHFFFHDMGKKVADYVSSCISCLSFTDKKTHEPIQHHKVPDKCWDTVSVDLFGPMPSSRHVIVVQDLASRYPTAKLVSSTSADKVLPVLADIYDTFGDPEVQISDNGPPFNSKQMSKFADNRNIKMQKIPPLHPSSNPVETFMKPLGKAMKIGNSNHQKETEVLSNLLKNYRDTPHPATGVSPSAMMFRDGQKYCFPRKAISESQVKDARNRDHAQKQERQISFNAAKYTHPASLNIGDKVLLRNYKKKSKFDCTFIPGDYYVIGTSDDGRQVLVESDLDKKLFRRHPDDLKKFEESAVESVRSGTGSPQQYDEDYQMEDNDDDDGDDKDHILDGPHTDAATEAVNAEDNQHVIPHPHENLHLRRSSRQPIPNKRYFNPDFES